MEVRGAPLIGVTAAFALAFETMRTPTKENILRTFQNFVTADLPQ